MEQAKQKELRSLADDRANLADREAALMKEIKQLEDKIVDQEKHWSQANVRPPEADAQGDERTRYMQRQMQFARERGLAMAELQGKRKKLQEARSQLETQLTQVEAKRRAVGHGRRRHGKHDSLDGIIAKVSSGVRRGHRTS